MFNFFNFFTLPLVNAKQETRNMAFSTYSHWLPVLALVLIFYAAPTHAFGAGNIATTSNIEGENCEDDGYLRAPVLTS